MQSSQSRRGGVDIGAHQKFGAHSSTGDRAEDHLLVVPREQIIGDVAKHSRQCKQLLQHIPGPSRSQSVQRKSLQEVT